VDLQLAGSATRSYTYQRLMNEAQESLDDRDLSRKLLRKEARNMIFVAVAVAFGMGWLLETLLRAHGG
jgi:hypothetical protein